IYACAAYCKLQLGQYDDVVDMVEQGKNRLFALNLIMLDAENEQLDPEQRQQLGYLKDQIKALEFEARLPETEDGRRSQQIIDTELRQTRNALQTILTSTRGVIAPSLSQAEILSRIPEHTTLVMPII